MEIGTMRFITLDEVASCVPEHGMEWCLERYGGKAVNLSKLASEGFCVPPGFVISTEFFESIMDAGLCANPGMGAREVVAKMAFPQAFEDALRTAMDETPARCWAVRSSSTDEDSQTHSFAGLQESVIGVSSVEACLNAIRTVWQSFYARERLLYPSQASLSGPVPSMAVIVQAFVDSEVAGVVFTHHPMEGSRAMLVNVSRGQGAMVVDGKAGESLCIDRRDGENITASECLNERDLRELIRVSLDIERHFGKPQDIEFAFADGGLFILQTRDIVAPGSDERSTLYSNVNVGEALSGVCSPMTWSVGMRIAKEGFETVFGALGLSVPPGYEFVTTFGGHIYLNVSEILECGFTGAVCRSQLDRPRGGNQTDGGLCGDDCAAASPPFCQKSSQDHGDDRRDAIAPQAFVPTCRRFLPSARCPVEGRFKTRESVKASRGVCVTRCAFCGLCV